MPIVQIIKPDDPDRGYVLFFHGLWGNQHSLQPLIEIARSCDLGILNYELPGRGGNDPILAMLTLERVIDDIQASFKSIPSGNIEGVIGHSLGGYLAQYVCSHILTASVRSVVLIASAPSRVVWNSVSLLTTLKTLKYFGPLFVNQRPFELQANDAEHLLGTPAANPWESGRLITPFTWPKYLWEVPRISPLVNSNVMVAHGRKDRIVPVRTASKLADYHHVHARNRILTTDDHTGIIGNEYLHKKIRELLAPVHQV